MRRLSLQDLPAHTQASLLGSPDIPRKQSEASKIAEKFGFQLRSHMFAGWIQEHRFATNVRDPVSGKPRQWRFDFAHVELKLAVEIEGLRVQRFFEQIEIEPGRFEYKPRMVCTGRHSTADGYREDCEKYANAAVLGWQVLRFVQKQVTSEEAINFVENWYGVRGIDRRFVK